MKLDSKLAAILSGTAIVSTIVITMPQIVVALLPSDVNKIAEQITVLIDGQNPGSGVIIAKAGNTYYVLTAEHVVRTEDEYKVVTPDGLRYPLKYSTVKKLPKVDLAVLQFTSDKNYSIAKIADSDQVTPGVKVYINGFPNPGSAIIQRIPQFTDGSISAHPKTPQPDGYALIYTNLTRVGMSGGPVLDGNGNLVGIHGRADGDGNESGPDSSSHKNGFNLGIPINTFLSLAPKVGLNLPLQIENKKLSEEDQTTSNSSSSDGSIITRPRTVRPNETHSVCAGHC